MSQGERGERGQTGEQGLQGSRGPAGGIRLTDRRIMLIFIAVALVGVYLIHSDQVTRYHQCRDRAINVNKANHFYVSMAELESKNPFIDQKLRNARVKLYSGVVYAQPKCGAKPWFA